MGWPPAKSALYLFVASSFVRNNEMLACIDLAESGICLIILRRRTIASVATSFRGLCPHLIGERDEIILLQTRGQALEPGMVPDMKRDYF